MHYSVRGNPGAIFRELMSNMSVSKVWIVQGEIINEHKFGNNLCHDLIKIDAFIETSVSQNAWFRLVFSGKKPLRITHTGQRGNFWWMRSCTGIAKRMPDTILEYDDRIEIQNPGGLYGKSVRRIFRMQAITAIRSLPKLWKFSVMSIVSAEVFIGFKKSWFENAMKKPNSTFHLSRHFG